MKKNELEVLDRLSNERKLNEESKSIIIKRVFYDLIVSINVLLLFITFMFIARNFSKELAIIFYKFSSIVIFAFTLVLFELAYKKDDNSVCASGIEMLFVSIITLLLPYIFIERSNSLRLCVGSYFAVYYMIKNIIVYISMKRNFIMSQSDIPEIIKKESQDKKALEEIEKMRVKEEQIVKEEPPKRKRGRPKKIKN